MFLRRLGLLIASLTLAALTACTGEPAPTPIMPGTATATATVAEAPPTSGPPRVLPTEIPTIALPPPPTSPPTPGGLDAAQEVAIYSVVAHDLVRPNIPPYIAIAPTASQGEFLDTPAPDRPISPDLVTALQNLTSTVEIVPFIEAIGPLEQGGHVRNDGLFLTMGVIEQDPGLGPHGVKLYASFYRASDDATGYLYQLVKDGNQWVIKNKTEAWDH